MAENDSVIGSDEERSAIGVTTGSKLSEYTSLDISNSVHTNQPNNSEAVDTALRPAAVQGDTGTAAIQTNADTQTVEPSK